MQPSVSSGRKAVVALSVGTKIQVSGHKSYTPV